MKKHYNKIFYTYNGKSMDLKNWSKEVGMKYRTLYRRIKICGLSFENAINIPVKSWVKNRSLDEKRISKAKNKREWRKNNPELAKEIDKKKHLKYKESRNTYSRKYAKEHKHLESYREVKRKYHKNRWNSDIRFRLDKIMASSLYKVLKEKKDGKSWKDLVGYGTKELKEHLEKQFDNKMSWDNYGIYWHIDHIKPKTLFNYSSPEDKEFIKCWSLNNLQPLEKITNIKKGNRYEG
jgi:hypothetical protein